MNFLRRKSKSRNASPSVTEVGTSGGGSPSQASKPRSDTQASTRGKPRSETQASTKGKPRSETQASSKSSNSRGSRPRKPKKGIDLLNNPDGFLTKLISAGLLGEEVRQEHNVDVKNHRVLKEGMLEKQGQVFKSWHKRHFVLRSRSLSYYESERKYKSGQSHLGVIFFKDIIDYNGQYVQNVPDLKVMRAAFRGKDHLFVINKKERMYIINASSDPEKKEWEKAINSAVARYMRKKEEKAKEVERRRRERKESAERAKCQPELFFNINNMEQLDEEFDTVMAKLTKLHKLSRTMAAWKVYTQYSKAHKRRKQNKR